MTARTFSVGVETRKFTIRDMLDDERAVVIRADPLERPLGDGQSAVMMGFPVLIVSPWVAEAEDFAAKVAKLLEEHQP